MENNKRGGRRRRLYSGSPAILRDHPPSRDSRVNSHTSRGIPSYVPRSAPGNSLEMPAINNESIPQPQPAIGMTSRPFVNF